MKKIDLIVPCYNETEMIQIFYNRVCEIISEIPNYLFNIIFIDDGSNDDTFDKMVQLSKIDERVKYIGLSRNFGKEAAMYAGLKNSSGDYVVIIDVDLQHPPELIPVMIKAVDEEEYDTCAARRVSREGEPKIRSYFARKFYKLINSMTEVEIVDGSVDYRMMNRAMVNSILDMKEVQRFSKGIFAWVGFRTKWVEFKNIERIAGETKWSFWSLLKYAISGITAFTTVPLRMSTFLGTIISFFSFLWLIIELLKTIILGKQVAGYASTIIVILFIGGIMSLFCGILGEYIARMYMETKQRPIYITRKTNINKHESEEYNEKKQSK